MSLNLVSYITIQLIQIKVADSIFETKFPVIILTKKTHKSTNCTSFFI